MSNKTVIGIGAMVCVLLGIVIGYSTHKSPVLGGAVSSSGTSNVTTSWSSIVFNPLTSSSTSIYNTGASDRAIMGSYVFCTTIGTSYTYATGAGLTSWTLLAATTTTNANGLQGSTNYIVNATVATATPNYYVATTTEGAPLYTGRIWPAGTYLTYNFNATNTASCSLGAEWMPL